MSDAAADGLTPAEERVREHLAVLREGEDAPAAPGLAPRVLRAARWQRAVRAPLQAVGQLGAAAFDGVRLVTGARRARRSGGTR